MSTLYGAILSLVRASRNHWKFWAIIRHSPLAHGGGFESVTPPRWSTGGPAGRPARGGTPLLLQAVLGLRGDVQPSTCIWQTEPSRVPHVVDCQPAGSRRETRERVMWSAGVTWSGQQDAARAQWPRALRGTVPRGTYRSPPVVLLRWPPLWERGQVQRAGSEPRRHPCQPVLSPRERRRICGGGHGLVSASEQ